jgi:nitrogen fixation NifU-like protein
MTGLADLYQQIIVDHSKSPRNFRTIERATRRAEGDNPLCGDRISVELVLEGDRILDVAFQGKGCAISQASASLMTQAVKGRSVSEAESLFGAFHAMATAPPAEPVDQEGLGKLAAFAGVRRFPSRVKCAILAWHTLHAALHNAAAPVSTE